MGLRNIHCFWMGKVYIGGILLHGLRVMVYKLLGLVLKVVVLTLTATSVHL